jgi:lipopolysaccharide export LptBFGC system permease protein LptF
MLSKKLSALVAISVLTASSAAVAQTAQPLSLAPMMRVAAPTSDVSQLDSRNGIGIYLIGAVVLGLIVWGVIELTSDDDGPSSP